ncbi:MAG: Transcriptional regulatory protein LiaR [Pseudomonadota bacterium]|jgi:DNA-binding NarL/FixJ family response regulator
MNGLVNAMSPISILIIDDHPVYRDALTEKLSLDFNSRGISLLGVSSLEEAKGLLERANTHWVVLLDLKLPNSDPIDNIKALLGMDTVKHLVVISGLDEDAWELACINAGADVFISKNNTSNFIYSKICELFNIGDFRAISNGLVSMTNRQLEVLKLIVFGTSNKLIADKLGISEQTVKIHVSAIFRLLNVSNRTQAVYKAKILRLV